MFLYCLRDIVYLLAEVNVERRQKRRVLTNGSVLNFVSGAVLPRFARQGAVLPRFARRTSRGCLLGNQTRDFVADFLIGILRPSQLGSATN